MFDKEQCMFVQIFLSTSMKVNKSVTMITYYNTITKRLLNYNYQPYQENIYNPIL